MLIGAGSVVFTQGLIADLIRNSDGKGWRLGLVDIDPAALDVAVKLCKKVIQVKKSDLELSYSTDRCDVLPGADYVISTIGVGGRRAWEQDVFIPRKYGIFQPVGDTVMPGGISRAMRMIPAMLDITADIEKYCADAYFFNYANPMTMICRAVRKSKGFPITGLCHGVNDTSRALAKFAGLDGDKTTYLAAGLNHLTFIYDLRCEGDDALEIIRYKLSRIKGEGADWSGVGELFAEMGGSPKELIEPFAWEFFETYGVYPAPGDRHITEFFAERFSGGNYYGKILGVDAYSFEKTIEYGDKGYEYMKSLAFSEDPLPESFFRRFSGEHEQIMEIIHSIEIDSRRIYSVNIPNEGVIPNLPRDAVLEIPAVAAAREVIPLCIGNLPDAFAALLSKHIAIAEITVEAALKGDRKLFAEAVLMGGYISDRAAVEKMVGEMLKAQKPYLPQF
ncbi:MAG: hypothetical protein ACM3WV_11220 [Bacillota bacterium]